MSGSGSYVDWQLQGQAKLCGLPDQYTQGFNVVPSEELWPLNLGLSQPFHYPHMTNNSSGS